MSQFATMSQNDENKKILHDLGERVKELTALYSTANILQKPGSVPELLQEIATILPAAWQYPDITTARIRYGELEFRSRDFSETEWNQSAAFATANGKKGSIDIFYLEERPAAAEGPFLAEERDLVNSLAEMVRIYLDRKHALEALKESEERFRVTFEHAAVGIMHLGIDGIILRANRKYCDILDYACDELVGRAFRDIACYVDIDRDMEYLYKLETGRVHTFSIEMRLIRKNNKPVWVNQTVSLVRGFTGEPEYFIFVIEDISDRKRAEEEKKMILHDLGERVKELTAMYRTMEILQQQKTVPRLLQEVVSILPDAWQYPDIAAARIYFDSQEYKTPNYRKTEWSQIGAFATYDARDGFVEVAYLEEMPEEVEGPFLAEERDLIDSIAGLLKSFLNRTMTEKALIESEKLYRTLAETAHDMVYLMDENGQFTYFNRYTGEIMGEDPENYIGKTCRDVYPPAIAEQHELSTRRVWETGEPAYIEEYTPFPIKSLWTGNWLVPIKDEGGVVTALMGIVRDIDHTKKAEEMALKYESEHASARQMADHIDQMKKKISMSIGYLEKAYEDRDLEKEQLLKAIESLRKLI